MDDDLNSERVSVVERGPSNDGEKPQRQLSNQDALSQENAQRNESGHEEQQYVTGFKFAIIMVSLTLVFFLVMLDMSIVSTVCTVREITSLWT